MARQLGFIQENHIEQIIRKKVAALRRCITNRPFVDQQTTLSSSCTHGRHHRHNSVVVLVPMAGITGTYSTSSRGSVRGIKLLKRLENHS
mmetsp:Transcript_27052/g.47787  ORF Transcript_27052/g.47787 Transcript_27052/m.47787 type:complete len:90 (-) Transcript_27052:312-581(-)